MNSITGTELQNGKYDKPKCVPAILNRSKGLRWRSFMDRRSMASDPNFKNRGLRKEFLVFDSFRSRRFY